MLTSPIARKAFPLALALMLLSQTFGSSRIYCNNAADTGYSKLWHSNPFFTANALFPVTEVAIVTRNNGNENTEVNRQSAQAVTTTTASAANHHSVNIVNGIIKQTG